MKFKRNYNHLKKLFLTVCFLAVGMFFSAISPAFAFNTQTPQFPNAANVTACADFAQVDVGSSVEGLGTVYPTLNISTSGNAISVAENQQPRAYGAPNGDASISNGGVSILGNGFSDIEQQHDYSFTFAPNVTVDYFSVNMLDYGDFNPNLATEHAVALVAYDTNGEVVSSDTLSFTSDGDRLPQGGSAGDLWLTGDAVSSMPGDPGNYFFTVTGNAITRVALEFSSNLGVGATDPFFALSVLCFSTEDQPIQPPASTVCANFAQLPVGTSVEGLGTIHPDLNISTTGNAIVVAEGQTPRAYGAPNGDNSISNGGVDVLLNGFYDDTQRHQYSFSFAPGVTVDYFSLNMLDYGDFNPVMATNHSGSLVAYDVDKILLM
ncbi:MAG: hypothetical protein IPJ90_16790 [Anaerolineaceae bacterium]|nr:hypothetical protein [Anaerolineaceae bacterium]